LGVWRAANPHNKNLLLRKSNKGKSWMDLSMMERVGDGYEKMEGSCSTGQIPQRAVMPVEEEYTIYWTLLYERLNRTEHRSVQRLNKIMR
jgi:hypothetical protein